MSFELHLAWAGGLPTPVMGVAVALLLIGAYHFAHVAFGSWAWLPDADTDLPLESDTRSAVIVSALIGYALAAVRSGALSGYRVRRELGFVDAPAEAGWPTPFERPIGEIRSARVVGAAGAVSGAALYLATLHYFGEGAESRLAANHVWFVPCTAALGWLVSRLVFGMVVISRDFTHEIETLLAIDVLDLRPLHAIGRSALQDSLRWIIGVSIASLFFLSPDLIAPIGPIMVVALVVSVASLLLPVRGVRQRIRAAKEAELARLEPELRAERDAILAVPREGREAGRLTDLLHYRGYLEGLSDWPFETSTWLRFGLYLLIPLGSWIGGALVERGLTTVLD